MHLDPFESAFSVVKPESQRARCESDISNSWQAHFESANDRSQVLGGVAAFHTFLRCWWQTSQTPTKSVNQAWAF